MMSKYSSDTARSLSRAASLILFGLSVIIVPQSMLRALPEWRASWSLFGALLVGVFVFAVVIIAMREVNRAVPRRSVHQLAETYLGSTAGLFVAAGRIVAYAMMAILGAELVVSALLQFVDVSAYSGWISAGLVLILALPVMTDRFRGRIRWAVALMFLAVAAVAITIIVGLVREAFFGIDWQAIRTARQATLETQPATTAQHYLVAALASCFVAAVVIIASERIMSGSQDRRTPPRSLLIIGSLAILLIAGTLYLTIQLDLPGRRLAIPILSIASAFLGEGGQTVMAVLFMAGGTATIYAAFRQLPQLIRELAIDGLLPRRLAAKDSVGPRRLVVAVIALVAALTSLILDSARAVAMSFIFVAFFIALLLSAAMVQRATATLKKSSDSAHRAQATSNMWFFRVFGIFTFAILAALFYAQPTLVLFDIVLLAVPGVLLLVLRRGQIKMHNALDPGELSAARSIPTRVRGMVLVGQLDQPTVQAITWARALRLSSLEAVLVDVDRRQSEDLRADWRTAQMPVPLTVLGTPQGAARGPIIEYVRATRALYPGDIILFIIPRVVSTGSWHQSVARYVTPAIVSELRLEKGVMISEAPYQLEADDDTPQPTENEALND